MSKNNIRDLITILLGSLMISLFYLSFFNSSIFSSSDYHYAYTEEIVGNGMYTYWDTSYTLGGQNILAWRLPIYTVISTLTGLGLSGYTAHKITYVFTFILLVFPASYYFLLQISRNKIAVFVGAILLSLNSYFMASNSQGHFTLSLATVVMIVSISTYIKFLRSRHFYLLLLTTLLTSLTLWIDLRMAYIAIFILLCLYIGDLLAWSIKLSVPGFLLDTVKHIFAGTVFVLLNLFWVLPMMKSSSLTSNTVLDRGLFGMEYWSLQHALTTYHPFWNIGGVTWFSVNQIPVVFYFIPAIVALTIFLRFKSKRVIFWSLIYLVGVFLGKGINLPFGEVYSGFFDYVPGFNAFRESTKFYVISSIGFSAVLALFVEYLITKKAKILLGITLVVSTVIVGYMVIPYINRSASSILISKELPKDYESLSNYLFTAYKDDNRVLWMPSYTIWSPNTNNHSSISSADLFKTLQPVHPSIHKSNEAVDILSVDNRSIIDYLGFQYIVIPEVDADKENNIYRYYGDRQQYLDAASKLEGFLDLSHQYKDISVFKNKSAYPRIFIYKQDGKIATLLYKKLSNTEYMLQVDDPLVDDIHFTTTYDNLWSATIEGCEEENCGLIHSTNEYGVNIFSFSEEQKKELQNRETTVRLYFEPQSYLEQGVIISKYSWYFSLVILFSSYAYHLYRIRHDKNTK